MTLTSAAIGVATTRNSQMNLSPQILSALIFFPGTSLKLLLEMHHNKPALKPVEMWAHSQKWLYTSTGKASMKIEVH